MKSYYLFILCLSALGVNAQLSVTEMGQLPEPVSNNAVCEGFTVISNYLYSFGGIDSTKDFSGIHLKSFRYDMLTGESMRIADLPDTLGKIACGASRVGNIIYVAGGYHVFEDESELSSNKMHRFDIAANQFISDGKNIPIPTDDHVQVVWRDSLIYLITGWSNTGNIPAVQIYDAEADEWMSGTSLPNANDYKSFGSSGAIVGDTIYFFGGATSAPGFGIQNKLRRGIINSENPAQIQWSLSTPDAMVNGYRMACTTVGQEIHWIGGSNQTYNYDGIAYNGSGGVPPSNRDLKYDLSDLIFEEKFVTEIPMDLRGIASVSSSTKYLAGGMLAGQKVTDKVYKLEWEKTSANGPVGDEQSSGFKVYPNPFLNQVTIESENQNLSILEICLYNLAGSKIFTQTSAGNRTELSFDSLSAGLYFIEITTDKGSTIMKIVATGT